MQFEGIGAIVTGGASGLGQASAELLAEQGAEVAVWDLNEDAGRSVARDIGGHFFRVDVGDVDSVTAGYSETEQAIAAPRILVHCAGIPLGEKTVSYRGPHSVENFERVIRVNLLGTFYCCRAAATAMSKLHALEDGERGVIITTSSVAAIEGQIGQIAYAASKAGVTGMTVPMARDLAKHGIRVCTITPGLFKTGMAADQNEKVMQSLMELTQFPARLGTPPEYASLVLEICRNRMLNGEAIRLDGAVRLSAR
jgi:NAD(P)-dependent dehydrogenase (short-subunit alcohol dehydrogenase family)